MLTILQGRKPENRGGKQRSEVTSLWSQSCEWGHRAPFKPELPGSRVYVLISTPLGIILASTKALASLPGWSSGLGRKPNP